MFVLESGNSYTTIYNLSAWDFGFGRIVVGYDALYVKNLQPF